MNDSALHGNDMPSLLPTLVLLPFLGGSWHEWDQVISRLSRRVRCIGIDLPGFGAASELPGYSVAAMADYVAARLQEQQAAPFVLVGHSMAGKVCTVLAKRWADESDGHGLRGVVLVCASPPAPEPMEEAKRLEMQAKLGRPGPQYRAHAEDFLRENAAGALPSSVLKSAVADVLRMNCGAWNAWLESGSKEDWSERVGVLDVPALLLAGECDSALGPAAQTMLTLPHFRNARMEVIPAAAHLLPMEAPDEVARQLLQFCEGLVSNQQTAPPPQSPPLQPGYGALIASERVSEATRGVLERRRREQIPLAVSLSADERETLQAVAECITPSTGRRIPFAAVLHNRLGRSAGSGWRYADLPPALPAYRAALAVLECYALEHFGVAFGALPRTGQTNLLQQAADGTLQVGRSAEDGLVPVLGAAQLKRWMGDLRADVTGIYMADPGTLAQLGYSGIGDGRTSAALSGFLQLGLGKVEPWEPKAGEVTE